MTTEAAAAPTSSDPLDAVPEAYRLQVGKLCEMGYGADFSEADEEIFKTAVRGNVVARGGSNVTNDVTA